MQTVPGFYDDYLTRHNEQRYLLQLGFVDRLLGRLVARLKSQGMYDDTLIVVTADHGFAWQVGVPTRRSVSPSNVEELGPVPLFVKAPGQTRGRVSDALARTLDVTPTIADVLNVPLGYRADGSSAFSRAVRARRQVSLTERDFSSVVRISRRALEGAPPRGGAPPAAAARLGRLGEPLHEPRAEPRRSSGRTRPRRAAAAGTRARRSRSPRSFARVRRSSGVVPVPDRGPDPADPGRARARPRDRREWPNRGRWAKLPPEGRARGELLGHGSRGCSARGPQHGGGARGNR